MVNRIRHVVFLEHLLCSSVSYLTKNDLIFSCSKEEDLNLITVYVSKNIRTLGKFITLKLELFLKTKNK